MKLFSEKVSPTLTNSPLNILQVKNYEEIFFGVYEIEINETKYQVEKISENNGNPVVSVPVTLRGVKRIYPFVLSKGKFEILFNENNKSDSDDVITSNSLVEEKIDDVYEFPIFEEKFEEPVILNDNKKEILEQINKAKKEAVKYASKIKKRKINEANIEIISKKKAIDKMVGDARNSLVDEFISISNKIKDELIDSNDDKFYKINENIDKKILDLSNSLSLKLDNDFTNSSIHLESNIKELVKTIHSNLKPKIDNKLKNISNNLDEKVSEISNNLDEKVVQIEQNLDSKFTNKVDSVIESTIELNDKIDKGINKALSRVGNVDKHIEQLNEEFDKKIIIAEQNIVNYYNEKIESLEKTTFESNENIRKFFIQATEESKYNLINEVRNLKDFKPVEYIIESKDKNIKIKSDDFIKDLDKKINTKINDEIIRLKKYISIYSGGGGSVAKQFAGGGLMDGDLTIVGSISASQYLGLPVYTDTDTLSTVTGRGNVTTDSITVSGLTVIDGLTANRIYTTQLDALSANITVLDIKQYELNGLNIQGDHTIQGSISAGGIAYAGGGKLATETFVTTLVSGYALISSLSNYLPITFETVSKNLKSYPATYTYSSGILSSIIYTTDSGSITKTFNYTSGLLTSIVLSGNTPSNILLTKSFGYSGSTLINTSYT